MFCPFCPSFAKQFWSCNQRPPSFGGYGFCSSAHIVGDCGRLGGWLWAGCGLRAVDGDRTWSTPKGSGLEVIDKACRIRVSSTLQWVLGQCLPRQNNLDSGGRVVPWFLFSSLLVLLVWLFKLWFLSLVLLLFLSLSFNYSL